jgi:hypothetical protein
MSVHNARQIYATMTVEGKSSSVWSGEVVVNGWRLKDSGATLDALDAGTVPLDLFHAQDASVSRTITGLTVEQGWAGVGSDNDHEVTDGDKDAIATAILAYWNAIKSGIPDDYQLRDIRLYPVAGTDPATGDSPFRSGTAPDIYTPTAVNSGGTSGNWASPGLALAISTQSATRGPKGRGRWFYGPVTGLFGDNGLVNSGSATVLAGYAATMLNAIRAIGGTGSARYAPVIWHRGTDTASVISSVRIGDELDFQQRRRRQRPETYISQALT